MEPHRRAYLDREGPVSRGRGSVRRIAAGICTAFNSGAGRVSFEIFWDSVPDGLTRYTAEPSGDAAAPRGPSGDGVPMTITPEQPAGR